MNLKSQGGLTAADIPWKQIDTVLLDMDGTLLDLNYDNHVWNHLLPLAYAETQQMDPVIARETLFEHMLAIRGTMAFYTIAYWSDYTGVDLISLHQQAKHLVALRPGAGAFLSWLASTEKQSFLATNADRASVDIKQTQVDLTTMLTGVVSSHDYGYPKEDPLFWYELQNALAYDPSRTLFIDDNEPVLDAAEAAQIEFLVCVTRPDSNRPSRSEMRYPAYDHFQEIYVA